jgi:hypothetical protein
MSAFNYIVDASFSQNINSIFVSPISEFQNLNNAIKILHLIPTGEIMVVMAGSTNNHGNIYNESSVKDVFFINKNGTLSSNNNSFYNSLFSTLPVDNKNILQVCNQIDGKILIAVERGLIRFNSNFTIDQSFTFDNSSESGYVIQKINFIAIGPDEKIYVCGKFFDYGGDPLNSSPGVYNGLIRLNSNGTRDQTFSISLILPLIDKIIFKENNDIILCGDFSKINNTVIEKMVYLNESQQINFFYGSPNGRPNGKITNAILLANEELLIGGDFNRFGITRAMGIAKIDQEGFLSRSTNGDSFLNVIGGRVMSTIDLSDGKILLTGAFTQINGLSYFNLAQLNSDGTIDTDLQSGLTHPTNSSTYQPIRTMTQDEDGNIIVGGAFTTLNNVQSIYLAKLVKEPVV